MSSPHAREHDVRLAVAAARERFATAGVPSPAHDARALAEWACGASALPQDFTPEQAARFADLVAQRQARVPLQHLTGKAFFRYLTVEVGPGVFIPRPETEVVAGAAIAETARLTASGGAPVVVDLATGSGVIALSVATEVAQARVFAVELDDAAFAWAQRNLAESQVTLRQGDLAEAFADLNGQVDVVVSNPPYIPTDAHIRDPEVATHDPALALWSGEDGLTAIRAVERTAFRLLTPGGLVVVEHADQQGESAPAVFADAGWEQVADHRDLADRPRFLTARRR